MITVSAPPIPAPVAGPATATRAVNLALVGLNFGRGIALDLARSPECGLRVVAVCDQDQARARSVATELGVPAHFSLDSVLSDPSIEAVGLFTGPHDRAAILSRILRSGRDVITTKPFEVNLEAARAVLAEAHALGRIVHLNSPTPVEAEDVRAMRRLAKEHDLGRPLFLRAETWAGYREKANGSWYDNPELCPAAPILRLGIYFLNDFCPLLGEPEAVQVQSSHLRTGRPTPDHAQVGVRFANGALAQIFASFCIDDDRAYRDDVTLVYERGSIRRWIERPVPHVHAEAYAVVECQGPGYNAPIHRVTLPKGAYAGQYRWNLFARSVRGQGLAPQEHGGDPLYGVRLLAAVAESCRSGVEARVQA